MSDIPLRKYLEELEGLIDKQQIDEAIAHCRHILSFYPKHIDTYRVLGKALLEKGRHGDAADIFQRVLSSVPDDFVAHVGMSIVREDEANLEAALWHMERAFEATPSNGPIQDELRRLYGRRDGVVPPKARLTRGALARMYVKGDLYPQAEAELKAALAADPERVDLTTVLAQVYWRSDQRAEAAETCNTVLQKLPYSQEANRIIAALLTTQGRTNDAVTYRQRLEALDPYEAFVQPGSNGHGAAHVNPDAVRVPTLEYLPGAGESASGSPDWMQSIGEQFETPAATPAESMPDWMSESPLAEAPAAAAMSVAADMPDWMKDMQPGAEAAAPGLSFAPGESAEAAAPDWLSDLASTPAAPAEDMPDWLKKATGPLSPDSLPVEEEEATPPV
jgi:tetratricopeptide (TPR) repeat protein